MKAERLQKADIDAFVRFSGVIYPEKYRTDDKEELRQIIEATHPLSHYFTVIPLLVKEGHQIVARAVLTIYPEDQTAYLGYFESLDNVEAAKELFLLAELEAQRAGKSAIEGPLNASFWLGYRLKQTHFDARPYFGELYQPAYYQSLWEKCGYIQTETYVSNHYAPVDERVNQEKYRKRYDQFLQKDYQIKQPTCQTIDQDFLEVAAMIQDRFQDFPVYKGIKTEEFLALFADLKKILHLHYVQLAYDPEGKMVGFLVSVPNYGNLFKREKRGMGTILRFLWKKYQTKEYVILYMGVKQGHEGVGSVLVYALMQAFQKRNIQSISSYIQVGKVSGTYAFPSIERQKEYGYYRKEL